MRIPRKRRLGAVLLALAMVLSLLPVGALAAGSYSITVEEMSNGSIQADLQTANGGDKVTLTVTPDEGYAISGTPRYFFTIEGMGEQQLDATLVAGSENKYTFTMPEADVTVTATFVEQTPWEQFLQQFNGAGTVNLTQNVTMEESLVVPSGRNIVLDLKGKTLDDGTQNQSFTVANGGSLTLQDSVGGGKLEGSVLVQSGGSFTMSGGTITVASADYAVTAEGSFTMNGGSITNNSAGGVLVGENGTFSVSGLVNISGNVVSEEGATVSQNVFLPDGKTIRISGTLNNGSRIGVTTDTAPGDDTPVVITGGLSGRGTAASFTSDNTSYYVGMSGSEAALTTQPPALIAPIIDGHGLVLSSEIGVKFKVVYPAGYSMSNVSVDFSVADGRESSMTFADAEQISGQNACWFTCYLNAMELADTITATLKDGESELEENTYSAMNYINYVQNDSVMSGKPELLNLVNALQDYGYYMQQQGVWEEYVPRNHTSISGPSGTLPTDFVSLATNAVSGFAPVKNLANSGIGDATFSLALNEKTVLRVSVKPEENVTIRSTGYRTWKDGESKYYQFSTEKIGAAALGDNYTITVDTSQGSGSFTASAMSYVRSVLNNPDRTEAQKQAMAAYYYYYQAAKSYQ